MILILTKKFNVIIANWALLAFKKTSNITQKMNP